MSREQLEGRFNAKKAEFLQILKNEGEYIQYSQDKGYIYDLVKPVFGCLTRIRLSLKSGRILVHEMDKSINGGR